MNKNNSHKKDLIVIDFDDTIYLNLLKNYTINIPTNHILPARKFFSQLQAQVELFSSYKFAHKTEFILLTGRPSRQKRLVLSLLRQKGYTINEAYFSNYNFNFPRLENPVGESDFLIKYWSAKVDLINKIRHSNNYNSITIIDDDIVICTMLKELKFTIIHAQLTSFREELFIKFTPFNQRANLHILEEVMIHG